MDKNNELQLQKEKLEKEAQKFSRSPWVFFVRKSKLTYLIIAFLLIFGISSINQLPRELNPEVEIPIAVIATAYPGASPQDVEEQVTKEIESQIANVEGVKQITSNSSLGLSSITVEFEAGQDLEESIRKLKDEVDSIKADLPEDAFDPSVIEISISDEPILVATLTGKNYDLAQLKQYAENLESRLEGIPYVSDARVIGGRERQVRVEIIPERLNWAGLSLSQVAGIIEANNLNFPIGSLEIADSSYTVRMNSEYKSAEEISMIQISARDGKPVFLEDIANVQEDFSKEITRSRISEAGEETTPAVSIQVYKRTGGDITKVAEEARTRIENGKGKEYPEGVEVVITRDLSKFISDSIDTLLSNGYQTVFLIFLLLFVFLGWKEALIAGLSVPFSFFIAFIVMSLFGVSLNFLSLFSLVLALGLLVDSAIVIVEGMYEKVSTLGMSGRQAAIVTIKEYAAPLLSGMLTTVAAFFPLLFVIGIFGEFLKTIPIVVIATLTAALLVSLTIIPAIGSFLMNPVKSGNGEEGKEKWYHKIKQFVKSRTKPRRERWASRIFNKLANKYYNFIPTVISTSRSRKRWIIGVWVLFVLSVMLPVLGFLKVQSFAPTDAEFFYINLKMPNGTVLEKTDETVAKMEKVLEQDPEVVNFVTSVGSQIGFGFAGSSQGRGNVASIEVNLTGKDSRKIKSPEIVARIRKELEAQVTEGEISVLEQESGPPTGSAIEARVVGEDLTTLDRIATQVKDELKSIPTVVDAKTNVETSSGEIVFIPNKDILAQNGLSSAQVAAELRNGINRNEDLKITQKGEEVAISLGYEENNLGTIESLRDVKFKTSSGEYLAVSELGEIKLASSLASISHRDEERVVSVTAGTEGGNPTEITQELQNRIKNLNIPSGYEVQFGGETQELQEVYTDMLMKMIIGIILILFILVIQFNSYKQVLIILFTIPLAMIGVIWGMTLARLIIDIPSFIGIVSLAGIVVNNAIILIDQINREMEEGKDLINGVRDAGRSRLRPVILTTVTTIFGLLPLSLTQPDWRNMGFTIIFGLTFSTLLTLIIVPILYVSFYRKRIGE